MFFQQTSHLNKLKAIIFFFINCIFLICINSAIAGPNSNASCALDLDYTTPEIDSSISVTANSNIWIAVIAQNVQNLDGYQVEIEYDPNRLQFLSGIEDNPMGGITNLLKKNGGTTVGFQALEKSNGLINVANALAGNNSNQAPEGNGVIAIIQLKLLDELVDNCLDLSNVHFLDSQQTNDSILELKSAVINPFVNTPPQISKIEDQLRLSNKPIGPITFTIHDNESLVDSLELAVVSSNQELVPNENIIISGSGSVRELTILPAEDLLGTAQVEISVSDGAISRTTVFILVIDPYWSYATDMHLTYQYTDKIVVTWNVDSMMFDDSTFHIWRYKNSDKRSAQLVASNINSPYTDFNVTCEYEYRYILEERSIQQNYSYVKIKSGVLKLETPILTSASYRSYTDKISIGWKESPCATEYEIRRTADVESPEYSVHIARITENVFDDYDPIPERRYFYWIRAINQYSYSDLNPLPISGMRRLATPRFIKASNCEYKDRIIVEWEPVIWKYGNRDILVKSYKITFFECDNNVLSESIWTGKASYTFTNEIIPGRRYCFQVQAANGFGWSEFSETTTGTMKLPEPINVFAGQGNEKNVQLSWDLLNYATGYEIYRTSSKSMPSISDKISGEALILTNTYIDNDTSQRYYYWIKSKFEYNDCGGADQLFSEPAEGWPQNAQTKYFNKSWTGNPYNRMNFWIQSINGYTSKPGDEIAIYDNDLCVGSSIISYTISKSNPLLIETSQDDGRNNGFISGNPINIKIWNSSENTEINVIPVFYDIESEQLKHINNFEPVSDYALSLNAGYLIESQIISIQSGYNIISFHVDPFNKNLMTQMSPLIQHNTLYKIIDQSGSSILKVYDNWSNTIGNLELSEGYQIFVTEDSELTVSGLKVDLPKEIQLSKGWNIVGYPCGYSQTAQTLLKPLIDSGNLIKVIGHRGSILQVFGEWRDQPTSFFPGEGYQVKVNASSILLIDNFSFRKKSKNFSDNLKMYLSNTPKNISNQYHPIWEGNPYNRMNLWVVELNGYDYQTGDEIGVFDTNKCVGVGVIQGKISKDQPLIITTSQDDGSQNGFTNNNRIDIRIWDSNKNKEIRYVNLAFEQISDGKPLISQPTFKGTEDYGVRIDVPEITINDVIVALQILSGVKHSFNYSVVDIDHDQTISMIELLYLMQTMK